MGEITYTEYPFKTRPYKHQLDCWRMSKDLEAYALFMEMGCIDGEAEIQINWFGAGRRITLGELFTKGLGSKSKSDRGVRTRSFIDGNFRLNKILGIFNSGEKETVSLELTSGKSLILTPDHKVLTTEGWVMAQDLRLSHEVLTNVSKIEWDLRKASRPREVAPPCSLCGNPNSTTTKKSKYYGWCRSCIMKYVSINSDGWTIDKDGYVRVGGHKDHPRATRSGQVLEHILVMEEKLGRPLLSEERVHHKDEDPRNNDPGNLVLMTKLGHGDDHEWFKNLRQDVFTPVPDRVKNVRSTGKRQTFDLAMDEPSHSFIANGITVHNCGKTKVVIDNAGYLFLKEKIDAQVIVAPKGVYLNWIENEIPVHNSEAVPLLSAYWSSYARKEEKEALKKLHQPGKFLRTFVVNVEAMASERAVDEVVAFLKKYKCMMTIDESTTIKNPQAKRTKILINLGKFAKYRRICSGNPIPNGPLDLYSQSEFLQKNLLGYSNYFAFRNRFAVLVDQQLGRQSFKKVVGYRDLDSLKMLMRRFSYIIKKADCLDLPHKVYQTVDITMGPRQTAAYNKMLQDAFIQLSGASQVSATMIITQLLRLHQISCGFLKPDQMEEVPFGEENDRLETLLDLLEQAPGKVIIWATYRYNIREIIAAIGNKFGEKSVVDFYGATSADDRKEAKAAFQDPNSPVKYMVSNPASGRFGNTWTQGTTVIYYSNDYNLESREQSEDRAHRIGQSGAIHGDETEPSVLYIDLRAKGTVDEKIIKVLRAKKKLTDEVVASNWQWLMGSSVA
jgi:hypothetical protein